MSRWHAIETPTFQPALRLIDSITKNDPTTVTTTFDHDYETGTIVRIYVPNGYGMKQMDKLTGKITVTGTDTFTMDIDTTSFDAFAIPGTIPHYVTSYPSVVPIGEDNGMLTASVRNVLPHN